MSVWDELVDQGRAVKMLRRAVAGDRHAMIHAWLFVGPPGSRCSNAACVFAVALQCRDGDYGRCNDCRTSLSGAHPDMALLHTEQLSIGVDEVHQLVPRASVAPAGRRWQVVVIEDTDHVTERGADALLKALEEPAPKAVWLLCAPSANDVIVTIRSRCQELRLVTPPVEEVARLLIRRDGVGKVMAQYYVRATQGHVGRARALALNEEARKRRHEILSLPVRLNTLTDYPSAAESLVTSVSEEAGQFAADLDAREMTELRAALGMGTRRVEARGVQGAIRELEDQQKARMKRFRRGALDRVLTELTDYYRDVLACQTTPGVLLVNTNIADGITTFAGRTRPEQTMHALDALLEAHKALEGNVVPQLASEAMLLGLGQASHY